MSATLRLILAMCAVVWAQGYDDTLSHPPRGWDSYDAFPCWFDPNAFNETVLLQQAALLSTYNTTGRFNTLIIDEGWAEDDFAWILDEYGRPIPNPNLFPSAAMSWGFAPLAATLKAQFGLNLGLWIIRGIPLQAVQLNLSVQGTIYTARDIALMDTPCPWHKDVFAINMTHPAGQAYYNSIVQLFASWGVTYIKMDCVFGSDLDAPEINGMIYSLLSYGNEIRLSLSPGTDVSIDLANSTGRRAHLYRITDDLWDCWSLCLTPNVVNTTRLLAKMEDLMVQRTVRSTWRMPPLPGMSFPDPDMISFGTIRLPVEHTSTFTQPNLARYVYGMWSITGSPIVLGGEMGSIKKLPWLDQLLQNEQLAAMQYHAGSPRAVLFQDVAVNGSNGQVVWRTLHRKIPNAFYLGFFAFCDDSQAKYTQPISIAWKDMRIDGILPSVVRFDVTDVVAQKSWGTVTPSLGSTLNVTVPANDALILFLLPTGPDGRAQVLHAQ